MNHFHNFIKIEDMVYIHNGTLLSHIKEPNNAVCSNTDGTRDSHTKRSQSERERQIAYDITYMWTLKYGTNESVYKMETHRHREQTCGCQVVWGGSGMDLEFGVSRCYIYNWVTLLYSRN